MTPQTFFFLKENSFALNFQTTSMLLKHKNFNKQEFFFAISNTKPASLEGLYLRDYRPS